jgi:hypothetical protein
LAAHMRPRSKPVIENSCGPAAPKLKSCTVRTAHIGPTSAHDSAPHRPTTRPTSAHIGPQLGPHLPTSAHDSAHICPHRPNICPRLGEVLGLEQGDGEYGCGWGTSRVCREYPREEKAVAVADRVVHPIDGAARAGEVHLQGALTGTHGYSRVLRRALTGTHGCSDGVLWQRRRKRANERSQMQKMLGYCSG